MSGHSKWATIKRKKGKADQERGRVFTRHTKEIARAAREGGGDPAMNARLRTAVANAKAVNMPADNIKRAILKGTGQLPGVTFESVTYEGYGPGGTALFIEVTTDNKNRIVAEVRHLMAKYHGNLGENGCVAWMFDRKGLITVELESIEEDKLMDIALEAGAEDIKSDSGVYEIMTDPTDLDAVVTALEAKEIAITSSEVTMIPQNTVKIEKESEANAMLKLMEALDENDDVEQVHSNFDIDSDLMERLAEAS